MKALSLTQPWATLIAIGAKKVETRSWSTNHRGLVAIHASKGFPADCRDRCWDEPFRAVLASAELVDYGSYADLDSDSTERFIGLPLGAIVALGRLREVVPTERLTSLALFRSGISEQECAFGDYSVGRFAWVFDDVVKFPAPIPCKGALGLWDVPPAIAEPLALLSLAEDL